MTHIYNMPGLSPSPLNTPPVPRIIGLSGYARSGKDTVAGIINRLYGHQQISFAAKLKELAYDLDPIVSITNFGRDQGRLAEMVDNLGWEKSKECEEVRRLLQVLGTKVREHLGSDIWVLAAMQGLRIGAPGSSRLGYVFSDVRFPNEADEIQRRGGSVLRIVRPGVEPVNPHVSETALDAWDFDGFIHNDKTLDDLEDTVRKVLES